MLITDPAVTKLVGTVSCQRAAGEKGGTICQGQLVLKSNLDQTGRSQCWGLGQSRSWEYPSLSALP